MHESCVLAFHMQSLREFEPLLPAERRVLELAGSGARVEIGNGEVPTGAATDVEIRAGFIRLILLGLDPDVPLSDQTEDDLIWIRAPFHIHQMPHPKTIIHGHTPVEHVTRYPSNRINIDTGAAYGGPMSAIVIDRTGEWELTASGRRVIPMEA